MAMTSHYTVEGKRASLLGYGAMRLPTIDGGHANAWSPEGYSRTGIDQDLMNRQIKTLLDAGVTYFDTSPAYCRGESERRLGEALQASGYPRESYIIATKLSNFAPQQKSLDACKKMFEDSLKYLQTDYIDNYLLHAIGNGGFREFESRYLTNGALNWCVELRKQGKIRHLGFSYHGDPKAFEWCMLHHDTYKWDFVQIQMNYIDWNHAAEINPRNLNAKYLYEELAKRDIPVVIMEPLLGGRLAQYNYALAQALTPLDPEATLAKWAFRFCGSFPKVLTVLSGMTRMEHAEENIETFSPLKPCSDQEFAALERAATGYLNYKLIPCTACSYCMPCPYGLDIPGIFAFRNSVLNSKHMMSAKEVIAAYNKAVPEELRHADHCTTCGRCVPHCPQSIKIPEMMAEIDAWIDALKDEEVKR